MVDGCVRKRVMKSERKRERWSDREIESQTEKETYSC